MIHEAVRLTDFADFKNGKALKTSKLGEVPVFGSNGQIGLTEEAMGQDAVIVGRVGAYCGAIHPAKGEFWASDNTIVARPRDGNSLNYLFYLLTNTPLRDYAGGAAQPLLTQGILSGVRVRVHGLNEQAAIADILSAYDDLIETNRRRIALLEEAARLLYREWFVHFRFPGHEHVPLTDGLPEGWERRTFGEIAELKYGKALKQENRVEGPFPVYGSSGVVGTHQAAMVEGPTIIVGRKGNVGSIFWSPVDLWPIDTVYFIPKVLVDFWLYLALPSAGFQNTDAGVPGLNRDFAYSRKLIQPPARLRRLFNEIVEPMFEQRATLETYNQKLAQARDLLLPRLMNGELAV
ncbi:MAG: restriction endonuclease subunit S [Erythrobacter sp.]|nr:restriction endonuclease subunit S [Erythrobacter sp.]